jgi:nucleoid-associated protein YgaU
MANPIRAFSVLGLGAALAGGVAWTSGELQRFGIPSSLVQSAALVDVAPVSAKTELSALTKAADNPANPAIDQAAAVPTNIPVFDIVRVQPDGSLVIAGRAAPGAAIDIIAGPRVIGQTSTDESGSFAFVLDQPLAPGDYEIDLAARVNGQTLVSVQKAIVQIPTQLGGDVLAIVTAPGNAPEVISAGAINAPTDQVAIVSNPPVETTAPVNEPAPDGVVSANPAVPVATPDNKLSKLELRIEAVEIDGTKTFIAGTAPAGSNVRLYLGEILIGDAKANEAGRFLVESNQPVSVGTQILRADSVDPNGQVMARASVPFERVDGEKLAMVAPAEVAIPAAEVPANNSQANQSNTASATATATVAVTSPALTQVETSVIIRKGDTLWQIARRVYGKGVTFSTIYNANSTQITNPNRIWPGQVFSVPKSTETGDAADFNGIEGQKKEDIIVQ